MSSKSKNTQKKGKRPPPINTQNIVPNGGPFFSDDDSKSEVFLNHKIKSPISTHSKKRIQTVERILTPNINFDSSSSSSSYLNSKTSNLSDSSTISSIRVGINEFNANDTSFDSSNLNSSTNSIKSKTLSENDSKSNQIIISSDANNFGELMNKGSKFSDDEKFSIDMLSENETDSSTISISTNSSSFAIPNSIASGKNSPLNSPSRKKSLQSIGNERNNPINSSSSNTTEFLNTVLTKGMDFDNISQNSEPKKKVSIQNKIKLGKVDDEDAASYSKPKSPKKDEFRHFESHLYFEKNKNNKKVKDDDNSTSSRSKSAKSITSKSSLNVAESNISFSYSDMKNEEEEEDISEKNGIKEKKVRVKKVLVKNNNIGDDNNSVKSVPNLKYQEVEVYENDDENDGKNEEIGGKEENNDWDTKSVRVRRSNRKENEKKVNVKKVPAPFLPLPQFPQVKNNDINKTNENKKYLEKIENFKKSLNESSMNLSTRIDDTNELKDEKKIKRPKVKRFEKQISSKNNIKSDSIKEEFISSNSFSKNGKSSSKDQIKSSKSSQSSKLSKSSSLSKHSKISSASKKFNSDIIDVLEEEEIKETVLIEEEEEEEYNDEKCDENDKIRNKRIQANLPFIDNMDIGSDSFSASSKVHERSANICRDNKISSMGIQTNLPFVDKMIILNSNKETIERDINNNFINNLIKQKTTNSSKSYCSTTTQAELPFIDNIVESNIGDKKK